MAGPGDIAALQARLRALDPQSPNWGQQVAILQAQIEAARKAGGAAAIFAPQVAAQAPTPAAASPNPFSNAISAIAEAFRPKVAPRDLFVHPGWSLPGPNPATNPFYRAAQEQKQAEQQAVAERAATLTPTPAPSTGNSVLDTMFAITTLAESNNREFANGRRVTSPKGARGIAQVMPATANDPGYGVTPSNGTPADDARMGRDYLGKMLEHYRDPAMAWAAYNWGPGNLDEAIGKYGRDWLRHAPSETQKYVRKNLTLLQQGTPIDQVQDALGNSLINPFDPTYFNQALSDVRSAAKTATTPFSLSVEQAPMPDMPGRQEFAQKDFSRQDELLAQLAPQAFGEQDQKNLRRTRLWQGAAQALASLDDDAGVGTILARVGAGMLGGRLAANDEIQARADAYEEKMREYEMLTLQYEDKKADQKLQEANQEKAAIYQQNWMEYKQKLDQWNKDNNLSFENGFMVQTTRGADGKLNVKGSPIAPFILPAYKMREAEIKMSLGNASNAAAGGVASIMNQATVNAALAQVGEDPSGPGMTYATMQFARDAVDYGMAEQVVGPEIYQQMLKDAQAFANQTGATGSGNQDEAIQNYITGQVATYIQNDPNARERYEQLLPSLAGLRPSKRTTTRKTGNTTTRVQE